MSTENVKRGRKCDQNPHKRKDGKTQKDALQTKRDLIEIISEFVETISEFVLRKSDFVFSHCGIPYFIPLMH